MKIVSWNGRGFGRVDKRNEARKLVREKNPSIICLQETK
jgi:exonuclease III